MFRRFPRRAAALIRILAALSILLTVTACRQRTPAERLQEAMELLQQRQTALAIIKLDELVAAAPNDPASIQARLTLGQYFTEIGQFDRAENHLREVYNQLGFSDETGYTAFNRLLIVFDATKRWDDAHKALDEAEKTIANEPALVDQVKMLRAEVRNRMSTPEDKTKARAHWDDIMLTSKDMELRGMARERLADSLRREQKWDESNAVYERFITRFNDDPTTPQLVLAQAINLQKAGRQPEAEAAFAQGEKLMSIALERELNKQQRAAMLIAQATFNELFGRLENAEQLMKRVMAENQFSQTAITTQFRIGEMYMRNRRWEQALATFERIKKDNPNTNISQTADQAIQATIQMRDSATTPTAANTTQAPAAGAPGS